MLRLYGWLTPTNAWSSTSTLIRRSSCSSPATTSRAASRALADRSAAKAWPALPRTTISNHSTPTPATSTSRSVGSSRTTASARWPARQAASVPLPVHSSSITASTARSPRISSGSTRCTASQRQPAHGQAGLHVATATSVQPPVAADRFERRRRPLRHVSGRHDVDVPVEQQRRPVAPGEAGDDVVATVIGHLRYPGSRIGADVGGDGDAIDLEAAGCEAIRPAPRAAACSRPIVESARTSSSRNRNACSTLASIRASNRVKSRTPSMNGLAFLP